MTCSRARYIVMKILFTFTLFVGSDVYMQKQNPLLLTFYLFLETEKKSFVNYF